VTEDLEPPVPAVVKVQRDLATIDKLAGDRNTTDHGRTGYVSRLRTHAAHHGSDPLMPGGLAMVALAGVANLEAWSNKLDTAEQLAEAKAWRLNQPIEHPEVDDDDDWVPALQTLLEWSEPWRAAAGMEYDQVHTISTEVAFLRWATPVAYERLDPAVFQAYARDIAKARTRVENLLRDGIRSERGVPCMYDECKGKRLVRKMTPGRDEDGNKVWFHSKWHCPSCHREWDGDEYVRMKAAAAEATKIEDIPIVAGAIVDGADDTLEVVDHETWCSVEYAAKRTGRPAATIRVWAHRGRVPSVCVLAGKRTGYVRLADVEEQHALAERRAEAVRAGKRRRNGHAHVR